MSDIDARLREDVHLLGELLGNTIREQYGDDFLDKIEQIRKGAKADRRGSILASFANAVLLGINPFDQFGVELGKKMANDIEAGGGSFDASTQALLTAAGLD